MGKARRAEKRTTNATRPIRRQPRCRRNHSSSLPPVRPMTIVAADGLKECPKRGRDPGVSLEMAALMRPDYTSLWSLKPGSLVAARVPSPGSGGVQAELGATGGELGA